MTRFRKKVLLSLFLAMFLLVASVSVIAQEYTIKFAAATAGNVENAEYQTLLKFKELVEENSNGKIKIEIYPANQLGGTMEFTEGVSLGTIEMAVTGYGMIGNLDPIANVFMIPYLYRDLDHIMAVSNGPIGDEINQRLIKNTGLRVIGIIPRGANHVMNAVRPIYKPEDLKGLKIRVPEAKVDYVAVQVMGGIPVTITWGETYTSLSQGVVDGLENSIEELYNAKMHEVQKYLSLTNHFYRCLPVIINEKFYNGLPENYQKIILEAAQEAQYFRAESLDIGEKEVLAKMKEAGIEVIEPDIEAFYALAEKMREQFVDKDITSDLLERIAEYGK